MATKRKYLCGSRSRRGIYIDMEDVYRKLDCGMKLQEIADELGVNRSTIYKKHKRYQRQLETLEKMGVDLEQIDDADLEIKISQSHSEEKTEIDRSYVKLPEEYR